MNMLRSTDPETLSNKTRNPLGRGNGIDIMDGGRGRRDGNRRDQVGSGDGGRESGRDNWV